MTGSMPVAAQGGKPCHKTDWDECKDGTYVKLEFVIEEEDGNVVDCYFEEETDTGLVWVSDWESKDGEDCDPVSVELEYAQGFTSSKVLAYGGKDCDSSGYAEDPEGSDADAAYHSHLKTKSGNTAAISNLQFCIVEEQIFGTGEVAFGYEDLPKGGSDWDVNDLVVDMNTGFTAEGVSSEGLPEVTELTFDIIPQALGANDDHEWRLEFKDEEICKGGYELQYYDTDGNAVGNKSGGLPGTVTVFEHTQDLFDQSLSNAEVPGAADDCEKPNKWAQLTITFEDGCPLDIPTSADDCDCNGSDLFFGPVLENLDEGEVVGRGDERLVVVPDTWAWPLGAVQIWDAYGEVETTTDEDGNTVPDYTTDYWYEPENITDQDLVTNCNFEPKDDNSIESV